MDSGARAAFVVVALLLAADAPVALAGSAPLAGRLQIDARGLVAGATLEATLGGDAVFNALRERVSGRELVETLAIDGFADASPSGLGTPTVTLSAGGSRVELHDDARIPLMAQLASPATFTVPADITATLDGALVLLASDQGAPLGAVAFRGPARVALDGRAVQVVDADGLVLALRLPGEPDAANADAIARAFASGALFASATADGGLLAQAGDAARTTLTGSRASSELTPGHRTAILAYDLPASDYECLVDARPMPRASTSAGVLAAARQGRDACATASAQGRAFVLASVVDASRVDIVPKETHDDSTFQASDDGRIVGRFVSGILTPGSLRVDGFDVLARRADVFRSVSLGDAAARLDASDGQRFVLRSAQGTLTLVDEPDATILAQADQRAPISFALAAGVRAIARSSRVVELDSAGGAAGELVLLQEGALVVSDDAVRAILAPGERVLFRAPAESFASEPLLAAAIAAQRVGAHVSIAGDGRASSTSYAGSAGIVNAQPGSLSLLANGAIVIDAARSFLPARSAHDVDITVDGSPSTQGRDASELVTGGTGARHWVEIGANGSLRIIVSPGSSGTSAIVIHAPGPDLGLRSFPDGSVLGRHARLVADAEGLSRVVLEGRPMLDFARAGDAPFGAPQAGDITSEDATWRLSDGGALRLEARRPIEASLRLAEGVLATSEAPGVLDLGGASLILVGEGALRASGQDVRATLAAGSQLVLRARHGAENDMDDSTALDSAIASGKLASEIVVQGEDVLTVPFAGDVTTDTRVARGRIDITAESAQHEGRALLLALAPGQMPALERGNAQLLIDGEPMDEAASLAEVLAATHAAYVVLAGASGMLVVLNVPHFSVHTVTLQEKAPGNSTPLLLYATLFLGGLLAAETAVLAWRRRKFAIIVPEQEK